jgi:transcriptional regulator with XRE-family HTH domain
MSTMQTDLMRGTLGFVDSGPFDVASRAVDAPADTSATPALDGPPRARADAPIFLDDESFGARLRIVRERRRISIAEIAESTKILGALLEGLENDDFSRWPTGLYRRAFMRAYATAIGLDPEPVVREFVARFPDPEDVAAAPAAAAATLPGTRAVLRLTLAEPAGTFAGGDLLREARRRLFAVLADAAVLGGIAGALYAVVGAFWAPLALAVAAYYFASILVLGNTPGVCLVASRANADPLHAGWTQGRRAGARSWTAGRDAINRWRNAAGRVWRTWLGRE